MAAQQRGEYALAREKLEAGLRYARAIGHSYEIGDTLRCLGDLACAEHDLVQAERHYHAGLAQFLASNNKTGASRCLRGLAALYLMQAQLQRAAAYLGTETALRTMIGAALVALDRAAYEQLVTALQAQLGEETLQSIWQRQEARVAANWRQAVEEMQQSAGS
jgi:hypothetical protein